MWRQHFGACLMYTCMVTQASEPRVCYNDFLQDLNDVVPLVDPQPIDVLEFAKATSGLSPDDDALAVFAFDEVGRAWRAVLIQGTHSKRERDRYRGHPIGRGIEVKGKQ